VLRNFFRKKVGAYFRAKERLVSARGSYPDVEKKREKKSRGAPASADKFKTVSMLDAINRSAEDRYSRTKRVESKTWPSAETGTRNRVGSKRKYKIPSIRESNGCRYNFSLVVALEG